MNNFILLATTIALALAFTNCSDSDKEKEDAIQSDQNNIILFALEGATSTTIKGNAIYVILPPTNTETSHKATFTLSDKATASIQSGDYIELGGEKLEIVVTAEDGTERIYSVQTVETEGLQKAMLIIKKENRIVRAYTAEIDQETKTITFKVSFQKMDEAGNTSHIDPTVVGTVDYRTNPTKDEAITRNLQKLLILDKQASQVVSYSLIFVDIDE